MADKKTPQSPSVTQNVLKYARYPIVYFVNQCPVQLQTPYPLLDFISVDDPIQNSSWYLLYSEECLKTFNDCEWKLKFITPMQLAEAGFRYVGEPDRVVCTHCSKEFGHWKQGDDPKVVHKKKSPRCPFIIQRPIYQTEIDGVYTSPNGKIVQRNIENTLNVAGVIIQFHPAKFRLKANFGCRLETFNKCNNKIQKIAFTLCEAGFFYIGDGLNDHVTCFCCGQSVKEWEVSDEPWTTHARFSPTCSYLLLSKGYEFVQTVLISGPPVLTIKNNAIERTPDLPGPSAQADNQVGKSISEGLQLLSLQDKNPRPIPNSILCKMCGKEEMTVVNAYCGHVVACVQCAVTRNCCPKCKILLKVVVRVVYSYNEQDNNLEDPMLCKICRKEKMGAVFLTCMHVCACRKCAMEMNKCPVCSEPFCASMSVNGIEG